MAMYRALLALFLLLAAPLQADENLVHHFPRTGRDSVDLIFIPNQDSGDDLIFRRKGNTELDGPRRNAQVFQHARRSPEILRNNQAVAISKVTTAHPFSTGAIAAVWLDHELVFISEKGTQSLERILRAAEGDDLYVITRDVVVVETEFRELFVFVRGARSVFRISDDLVVTGFPLPTKLTFGANLVLGIVEKQIVLNGIVHGKPAFPVPLLFEPETQYKGPDSQTLARAFVGEFSALLKKTEISNSEKIKPIHAESVFGRTEGKPKPLSSPSAEYVVKGPSVLHKFPSPSVDSQSLELLVRPGPSGMQVLAHAPSSPETEVIYFPNAKQVHRAKRNLVPVAKNSAVEFKEIFPLGAASSGSIASVWVDNQLFFLHQSGEKISLRRVVQDPELSKLELTPDTVSLVEIEGGKLLIFFENSQVVAGLEADERGFKTRYFFPWPSHISSEKFVFLAHFDDGSLIAGHLLYSQSDVSATPLLFAWNGERLSEWKPKTEQILARSFTDRTDLRVDDIILPVQSQNYPLRYSKGGEWWYVDPKEEDLHPEISKTLNRGQSLLFIGPSGSEPERIIASYQAQHCVRPSYMGLKKFKSLEVVPREAVSPNLWRGDEVEKVETAILEPFRENIVSCIIGAEDFAELGKVADDELSILDMLGRHISNGTLQMIFTTTPEALPMIPASIRESSHVRKIYLEDQSKDPSLMKRLAAATKAELGINLSEAQVIYAANWARTFDGYKVEPGRTRGFLGALASKWSETEKEEGTLEDIQQFAFTHYQIPEAERSPAARQALIRSFIPKMNARYSGSDRLKKQVGNYVWSYLMGGRIPRGPRLKLLLPGLSGVGKTAFGRAFSFAINGEEPITVDMNEYAEGNIYALKSFLGEKLRRNRNAVFVFNEVENAHPSIQMALYEVMESPFMKLNDGTHVPVHQSWWIFTSNFGGAYFSNLSEENPIPSNEAIREYLMQAANDPLAGNVILRPLLNRMEIIWPVFGPETQQEFESVLALSLRNHLDELSTMSTVMPRSYSFLEAPEFIHEWVTKRDLFHPRGEVRSHVKTLERITALAIGNANISAPEEDTTRPCHLRLMDFQEALEMDEGL
jgi:hypothetical protein